MDDFQLLIGRGPAGSTAAVEHVRRALSTCGQRLADARAVVDAEASRIGALAELGELAGLRVLEVAERTGVSRQTVHAQRTALERHRLPLDTLVLAAFAAGQPRTDLDVIGRLAQGPVRVHEVQATIDSLVAGSLLREVAVLTRPVPEPSARVLALTDEAVVQLPARIRQASTPPARRWVVCVESDRSEAQQIEAQGSQLLGTDQVMVIDQVASDMTGPEIALVVEAGDDVQACLEATARMQALRRGIGRSGGPVRCRAIIQRPPGAA